MIHNMDRSGYFGASDCSKVMSKSRSSKTWKLWWDSKLGAPTDHYDTKYTLAGNKYEHPILLTIDENMQLDGQIILEKLKLRVNYDGYIDGHLYEIKTHNISKEFDLSNAYWMQCQVEMYVYKQMHKQWFLPEFKDLTLVSYALYDNEYDVDENEIVIDKDRLIYHTVKYDKAWITGEYLPKVKELAKALKKGKVPV